MRENTRLRRRTGGFFLAVALAFGHHSTASYDLVHGTIIQGIVTQFQWENPHVQLALDVAGENEEIEHWNVELESPSTLHHYGWNKNTLKRGDHVSVVGGRAKNGSFNLRANYVQWPDGQRLPGLAVN